jgi:lactate racemase
VLRFGVVSADRLQVGLAYGTDGLTVDLPAEPTTVVAPVFQDPAADPPAALRQALRRPGTGAPLRERVLGHGNVAISICDITRPQPRQLMVPAILAELEGAVALDDVVLLVATGTHRPNTDAELRAMLGDELVDSVRVVNHDSRDPRSLTWQGTHGDGVPVWLNSEWVDADFRITTGVVEPHLFAGFSGGPKMVAPGLAALETVLTLHDARRIGHPNARWGICVGNPVHDDIRTIAAATGVHFALDVVLNRDQNIVAAFGGDLLPTHQTARRLARRLSMRQVAGPFDIVVTTNSGYPLDQNLYQSVKGMSAAATVVKPGGLIVCAAECRDGFPDHGSYRQVLASADSPRALLDEIEGRAITVPDQWQVQIQAGILTRARVAMYSTYLSEDDVRLALLEPVGDIGETVERALAEAGPGACVCVLPEGPLTIPYPILRS